MLHDVRLGRDMLIYTRQIGDWLHLSAAEMVHACGQSRDAHGHPTHPTAKHARYNVAVPSKTSTPDFPCLACQTPLSSVHHECEFSRPSHATLRWSMLGAHR
jgi:hypothetical protein